MDLILLQAAGNQGIMTLVFWGLIILVFWLFMIRPQAKRQREQRQFIDALEKGQEVVTGSGLIGRINKIEDDIVTLDLGNKHFVRVLRSAISKEMTDALHSSTQEKKD